MRLDDRPGLRLCAESSRYAYANETESGILSNASLTLYYINERESVGAIDRNLLIGGVDPPVGTTSQPLSSTSKSHRELPKC
jgi:hypothetical protein